MLKTIIPASFYHFLCGLCFGIFLMLITTDDAGRWILWAIGALAALCLSGFCRPCLDMEEIKILLRNKGLLM